jgi:hypothetical protein
MSDNECEKVGVWARVKYSDNGVQDVPIHFFRDRGDVEPELLARRTRSEYIVFWSPKEEDTPASIMKIEGQIVEVFKMNKVIGAGAAKSQGPGWYKAELLAYKTSKSPLLPLNNFI